MNVSVHYGGRWFGNSGRNANYGVTVENPPAYDEPDYLRVRINFAKPTRGRGIGDKSGWVTGASLTIPREDAHRLAVAILTQLERPKAKPLKLRFKKA